MLKIKEILGSVRFWQLTAGLVLLILAFYDLIPQQLAEMIAGYLGLSIAIRTADKAIK